MKVLHVITDLYTGGAETALLNLLSHGLAENFETRVVSLREESLISHKINALGVPVHSMGMSSVTDVPHALWKLDREVRTFRPNIIQGWMYHGNLAASIITLLNTVNPHVLLNIRQCLYDIQKEKKLTRQVIRASRMLSSKAETIIYNCDVSRKQHEAYGFADNHAVVIPNGFDVDTYRPSASRKRETREVLGIPDDAQVIGHLARFHPMKNHDGFLRAAVRVANHNRNAHFVLAGSGVDCDNKSISVMIPCELRNRFHLLGEREDVPELLNAMDIFCLSSAWGEAFPNVLGEAMSSGVPCVATEVGESRHIIGDTGYVVPPLDSASLETALESLLHMPVTERQAMGLAARERIIENFGIKKIVDMYSDLYKRQT